MATKNSEQTRQHYRLATGDQSVGASNKGTQTKFAKGGVASQRDTTEFKNYGNGFRKHKGK